MNDINVALVDFTESGHHKIYIDTLSNNIKFARKVLMKINFQPLLSIKTIFKECRRRKMLFRKIMASLADKDEIIHFLYVDPLLPCLYNEKKCQVGSKILATLHHIPRNIIKKSIIKKSARLFNKIIVHSDYLKKELNDIGVYNVVSIEYPAFLSQIYLDTTKLDKSLIRSKYSLPTDKIILSFLGRTRKDKGFDILLRSLSYLRKDIRDKVLINIIGVIDGIYKSPLVELSNIINFNIIDEYIDDITFLENIILSDAILLPYRKVFNGASGPLSEAVWNNIPVIAPDHGNIGYLVKKYNLGLTFVTENARSLAHTIEKFVDNFENFSSISFSRIYKERLSICNFIKNYLEIYKEVSDSS